MEITTPVSTIIWAALAKPLPFDGSTGKSYSAALFVHAAKAQEFKPLHDAVKAELAKRPAAGKSFRGVRPSKDGWVLFAASTKKVKIVFRGEEITASKAEALIADSKVCRGQAVVAVKLIRNKTTKEWDCKLFLQGLEIEHNHDLTKRAAKGVGRPPAPYKIKEEQKQVDGKMLEDVEAFIAAQEAEPPEEVVVVPPPPKPKPEPAKSAKPPAAKPPIQQERKLRYPKVPVAPLLPIKISATPTYFEDSETENKKDENYGKRGYIGSVGSSRYIRDEDTTLLMIHAKRQGDDRIIDTAKEAIPPGSIVVHHRSEFDIDVRAKFEAAGQIVPLPEDITLICTKVLCGLCNIPSTALGDALDFIFGGTLRKGVMPRRGDYEDEQQFLADMREYLRLDLLGPEQLYAACRWLLSFGAGKDHVQDFWDRQVRYMSVSRRINLAGRSCSRPILEAGVACKQRLFDAADDYMLAKVGCKASSKERVINGYLRVEINPKTGKPWLPPTKDKTPKGDKMSYKLKYLKPLLEEDSLGGEIARACATRNSTMLSKYPSMLNRLDDDDRLRHAYHMGGAKSGRYTSGGEGNNSQNDPKSKGKTLTTPEEFETATAKQAQNAIRRVNEAPPGRLLVKSDMSQIEFRMAAHLGDRDDAFANNPKTGEPRDIHREVAALAHHGGDESKVTDDERQTAKGVVYGVNYHAGPDRIARELKMDLGLAGKLVESYNTLYPELREFRLMLHRVWCGEAHKDDHLPCGIEFGQLKTKNGRLIKFWRLPSKRPIFYWDCKSKRFETLSATTKEYYRSGPNKGKPVMETYEEKNKKGEVIKKRRQKRTPGLNVHPGTLAAHVISGICLDLMQHAMELTDRRLREEGLDAFICSHTHDEIIIEAAEKDAKKALKVLEDCMVANPPWLPKLKMATDSSIRKYLTDDDIKNRLTLDENGEVVAVDAEQEEEEE